MKSTFQTYLVLIIIGFVLGVGGVLIVNSVFTNGEHQLTPGDSDTSETDIRKPVNQDTQYGERTAQARNNVSKLSTDLEDISLRKDLFKRERTLYSYVAGLSEQETEQVLERTTQSSWNLSLHVREELQIALLEKLTLTNPEIAMNFALAHTDPVEFEELSTARIPLGEYPFTRVPTQLNRPSFIQIVFREWALYDVENAVVNAQDLRLEFKKAALEGIVEAQSDQSLTKLLELVKDLDLEEFVMGSYLKLFNTEKLENSETHWNELVALITDLRATHAWILSDIALQWYEQEGLSVIEKIQASTTDKYLKGIALYRVLKRAVDDSPDQALSHALEIPSHALDRRNIFYPARTVASAWATLDPLAALQGVEVVEKSSQRDELRRTVAATWAWNEPHYVLGNLEEVPSELVSIATSNAIRKIARTSPMEAAELTLQNSDDSTRFGLQSTVVLEWVRQDAEASIEWILNLPDSEDSRGGWIEVLTNYLAWSHPIRAFEIAVQQPLAEEVHGKESVGLEAQVIESIAYDDIDTAVSLLSRVREGLTKLKASTVVATTLIDNGDTNKALNLGLQLPESDQVPFFTSIATSWAVVNPTSLIESIEGLPSTEIRSALALAASSGSAKGNFNEKQLDTLRHYLTEADQTKLDSQ
ncbi:MAG: hypothetical protein F4W92_08570 [Gammaproteobacteria bacterium]|nr:hypothetical protein [Gammaproteobacteria bacterium]